MSEIKTALRSLEMVIKLQEASHSKNPQEEIYKVIDEYSLQELSEIREKMSEHANKFDPKKVSYKQQAETLNQMSNLVGLKTARLLDKSMDFNGHIMHKMVDHKNCSCAERTRKFFMSEQEIDDLMHVYKTNQRMAPQGEYSEEAN